MSKVICEQEELVNIADAIREKTGSSEEMALSEMAGNVRGITGGGATSWNDLTDKPFGEVNGDTLTWDGNTDGLFTMPVQVDMMGEEVPGVFCHISNVVPPIDVMRDNVGMRLVTNGIVYEGEDLQSFSIYEDDGYAALLLIIVHIIPYDNYTVPNLTSSGDIIFPYKGIYVLYKEGEVANVTLTIPNYTGFTVTKKLDVKYLPESHQFGEVNGDTFTWDGNTDGKIGVPELGIYLISDKPFSSNDVENGMKVTIYYKQHNAEQSHELRDYEIYVNSDGFITDESVFSVPYDNYVATDLGGIVFPNAGIYALNTGDIYVSSITIPGCTDFIVTKPLDAKYLPESVFKPTVLYIDTYTWLCRTPDGDDESNRITKQELMDIVKNSIAIQICQYEVDDTYIKYVTNVHFNAYKEYGEVTAGYNGDRYYTSEYIPMQE